LAEYDLRFKGEKCRFAQREMKFLGNIIESNYGRGDVSGLTTIKSDPEKIQAILDITEPSSNKELMSYLGMTVYQKRLVPNYSDIAAPLSDISTKHWTKETKYDFWNETHTESFNKLKTALATATALAIPNKSQKFWITADASDRAIGGHIDQLFGDQMTTVAVFSKKLSGAQCNWGTGERELFAIVYAITKFHYLLEGSDVVIRSDHNPLRFLKSKGSITPKQARWLCILDRCNWDLQFLAGKDNGAADYFSRIGSEADKSRKSITDQVSPKMQALMNKVIPTRCNWKRSIREKQSHRNS